MRVETKEKKSSVLEQGTQRIFSLRFRFVFLARADLVHGGARSIHAAFSRFAVFVTLCALVRARQEIYCSLCQTVEVRFVGKKMIGRALRVLSWR